MIETRTLSFREADALFEAAGATGIRYRAHRAIHEKRIDPALASQIAAVATALEANPRFEPVARELRLAASMLLPPAPSRWPIVAHVSPVDGRGMSR